MYNMQHAVLKITTFSYKFEIFNDRIASVIVIGNNRSPNTFQNFPAAQNFV